MGYVIAIAGKGGTGKTTIAALLVRIIKEKKLGSILAVDADPNSNLAEVLGVQPAQTIGDILDGIACDPESVPQGWTKDRFIEYQVQKAIEEGEGFDIITMGRPEGAGCYCYVNNVLRNVMNNLVSDYDYVIMDNEAGLEHLSRRTTRSADTLLVVSDASAVGLKAAGRIVSIVKELKIKTRFSALLVNRCDKKLDDKKIGELGLECIGNIPQDEEVAKASINGTPLWQLTKEAKSLKELYKLGDKIWQAK